MEVLKGALTKPEDACLVQLLVSQWDFKVELDAVVIDLIWRTGGTIGAIVFDSLRVRPHHIA